MRPPKCRRRRAGAICGGTAPRRDRPANSTGGRCPANSTSGHCPAPALRVGNGRRGRGPGLWRRTDGHGAAAPSAAMTTSGALHFPGTAPILGVRRPPATTVLCARYAGSGPCRQHMGRPPPPAAARRASLAGKPRAGLGPEVTPQFRLVLPPWETGPSTCERAGGAGTAAANFGLALPPGAPPDGASGIQALQSVTHADSRALQPGQPARPRCATGGAGPAALPRRAPPAPAAPPLV